MEWMIVLAVVEPVTLTLMALLAAGGLAYDQVGKYNERKRDRARRTAYSPDPMVDTTPQELNLANQQSSLLDIMEGFQEMAPRDPSVEEAMKQYSIRQIMGETELMKAAEAGQSANADLALLSMLR